MRVTAAPTSVIIQLIRKNSFDLIHSSLDRNFGGGEARGENCYKCMWSA